MASSSYPQPHIGYTFKPTTFSLKRYWVIENFEFYRVEPIIQPLESPVYYAPENDLCFKIFFYPICTSQKGEPSKNHAAVKVTVKSISGDDNDGKSRYWKEDARIVIDYRIRSVRSVDENYKNDAIWQDKYSTLVNSPSCFKNKLQIAGSENKGILKINFENQLTLECKIDVSYPTDSFSGIFCSPSPLIEVAQSGDHFKKMKALLETGTNSDITLVVGDEEFKVHKLHLSTHSAVFAAMFQHQNTTEATEKKVIVEDVSAETMRSLLHYIYTGTVESNNNLSVEVFSAADKYQLDALKEACEFQLSLKLTTDSVFTSLLYADLHNATILKGNCLKFIVFCYDEVIKSSETAWEEFTASARPELVKEVLTRVLVKCHPRLKPALLLLVGDAACLQAPRKRSINLEAVENAKKSHLSS